MDIKTLRLFFIMLVLSFVVTPVHHSNAESLSMSNVLITYDKEVDKDLINKYHGIITEEYQHIPIVAAEVPTNVIPLLEKYPEILSVEIDATVKVKGEILDWGLTKINTTKAWNSSFTGNGIKIAVLDTGIGPHDDLAVAGGISFIDGVTTYSDDNGHGTHISGIIGAKHNGIGVKGIVPDASLYSVKVLDKDGYGSLSTILKGIDWAITNKMDIINMSLAIEEKVDSPALHAIVDKAYSNGILLVAAAGNYGAKNGLGDTVDYPARYDSVIAVSAVDESNNRASFSGTGNTVEVAAPGVNILSSYLNNGYAYGDGTSEAAAFASGILAQLKQRYPAASNKELREKLHFLSIDLGQEGRDAFYGFGLLQAPSNKSQAVRMAGSDRFEVAVNVSKRGWPQKGTANTVVIANYNAFADALSAVPLAYKLNAPILLTHSDQLTTVTKQEIIRLQPQNIIIVGGTGSVTDNVYRELDSLVTNVRRIGGSNRFAVASNISMELNNSKKVIVANGLNFPDALTIAPYAAQNGYPILLTYSNKIPNETKTSLKGKESVLVIGGEGSVGKTVYEQLPNRQRIGGADRYAVASNIITQLKLPTNRVFIATGLTFPDALTGAVLAAKENAPLLLTRSLKLPSNTSQIIEGRGVNDFVILGGTGSVSEYISVKLENR